MKVRIAIAGLVPFWAGIALYVGPDQKHHALGFWLVVVGIVMMLPILLNKSKPSNP